MTARRTHYRRTALVCALVFGVTACDEQSATTPLAQTQAPAVAERIARLVVSADLVTLRAGEHAAIQLAGESVFEGKETWSTDDENIAQVDNEGHITAFGVGTTTITVAAGKKTTDVLVTVLPAERQAEVAQ